MPCAGAEAFLVMREERARDLGLPHVAGARRDRAPQRLRRRPGAWCAAAGASTATTSTRRPASSPPTIDFVQTYDDYPVIVMLQFEDLGFCEKGEGPAFVRAHTLTYDGDFPEQHQRRPALGRPGRLRPAAFSA